MNRGLTVLGALLAGAALVGGCSRSSSVEDELAEIERDNVAATGEGEALTELDPGRVPVRIGEGGERFAACQGSGRITQRGMEAPIPVYAAPFENAQQIDRLGNADAVYICARSHDQKWLGVVYAEDRQPRAPCGVTAPVPRRQDYAGPCRSGWVPSIFVRLVAG